ncbi:MAG: hypothetical protein ACI9VR_000051 [Cognaticolwellia sp.]|jgi:hypothetical protein
MHQRLSDLLVHQGLPTQPGLDLVRFLEPVAPLELSVHSHRGGVGAMINGDGPDYCERVLRLMAHFGLQNAGRPDLARATLWMNRFEGRRVFLKVDFGASGPREISLYFRRRPPVETVLQWLNQDGVDRKSLLGIAHTAQILGCPKVHFVAQSWTLEGESRALEHKLYFAQPPGAPGWQRTLAWLPTRSIPQATIARLQELELEDAQRFASIRIGAEGLKDGAKLDIGEPSAELVGLLAATDAVGQGRILSLMQSGPVDYLGWDVTAGAQGVGLYSTRG